MSTSKIVARKFIEVSIVYLLIGCVWGAIMTLPSVHKFNEVGPARIIVGMHSHWNLLGWVSMAVMGIFYYIIPVLVGKDLYSVRLAKVHLWFFNVAIIVTTALSVIAGYRGGVLYHAGNYAAIDPTVGPYMIAATIFCWIEAAANFPFAYNIYRTIRG